MKIISQAIAGSHAYGLSTIDSDVDKRGVFLNTDCDKILGLSRFEISKEIKEDTLYFELVHFFRGLRKTNTQMLEMLFTDDSEFTILTEEFKKIRENKYSLIDSEYLFKSLLGYIHNEKRLANGERTGELGGKRKKQLDQYGFSPKNFSHLFRLAYCGKVFFEKDFYPVNIQKEDKEFFSFIYSVKTEPERHQKQDLNKEADNYVEELKKSFDNRKNNFFFDFDLANKFCKKFYLPFLI